MRINDLVTKVHEIVKSKGFWDTPRETGTLLALIHSEVSEALEADTCAEFCTELADICMRIMDLCGGLEINLEAALTEVRDELKKDNLIIDMSSLSKIERSLRELLPDFNDNEHALGVHGMLSRALESDRKINNGGKEVEKNRRGFAFALASAFVLTLAWAAQKGYSIEQNIYDKMETVKARVFKKKY